MNREVARSARPLCFIAPASQSSDHSAGAQVAQLEAGQRLWSRGEPADHLAVICAGRLVELREHAHRQIVFDVLRPGDTIGEQALTGGELEPYDVESLRRATVVLVPVGQLRQRIALNPQVALKLMRRLAASVQRLTGRVEALSSGNVEHRLAEVLLGLVDRFGEPFDGGLLVPLKLRREDLAAMAATTQESISRKLTTWRKSGILVPQPAGYLVRDPAALRRLLEQR